MKKILIYLNCIISAFLLSLIPVFKILVDIENIETNLFVLLLIIYICILIVLSIASIYLMVEIIKEILKRKSLGYKIINILVLVLFNILVIPFFYKKEILNERINKKYLIYVSYISILLIVFFITDNIYKKSLMKINIKEKELSEVYNLYKTKDDFATFKFKYGFIVKDVNDYDLYAIDNNRNLVVSVFNYDITNYEQKTHLDFINKSVNDLKSSKDKFEEYEKLKTENLPDRVVTTVSYVGKSKNSSLCVYKFSLITFNDKPNNILYITEISIKDKYYKYKDELKEIVDSVKIN